MSQTKLSSWGSNVDREVDKMVDTIKGIIRRYSKDKSPKSSPISELQNEGSKNVINQLRRLEQEYREKNSLPKPDYDSILPSTLGKIPKMYEAPSDVALQSKAESLLQPNLTKKLDLQAQIVAESMDKLELNKDSAQISKLANLDNLSQQFGNLTEQQSQSMIRQGLVNSSINTEGKNDLNQNYLASQKAIKEKFDMVFQDIENKITMAQLNYDQAIKSYNLVYAADLEKQLDKLKTDREKTILEVNTYNQKITQEEAKYQKSREEQINQMEVDRAKKQDELDRLERDREYADDFTPEKAAELDKRLSTAQEYYNTLPKDTAKALLQQNQGVLSELLGKGNYAKLVRSYN